MTQATDLFPIPPLCPFFSIPPYTSAPANTFHSFLHPPFLRSPPPCAPRSRVRGRCNAGPILSLSATPKHPLASRQWYVAGSVHQTPRPSAGWNWETDNNSCSELSGARAGVSFLTVERGNVFPGPDALFEMPPCQQTGYSNS